LYNTDKSQRCVTYRYQTTAVEHDVFASVMLDSVWCLKCILCKRHCESWVCCHNLMTGSYCHGSWSHCRWKP